MKINHNETNVLVDIDGTLILYDVHESQKTLELNYYGMPRKVAVHHEHVELLKSYKQRGFFIRAHSNNGKAWVEEVITKLGLQDFIDEGETKASKFLDDALLPSNEVVGQRVFIPYKKEEK